jgi:hypothetical protein
LTCKYFFLCETDAVKRRTLPAWIREGLEKMEREKQKKLEKERMEQQRSQLSKKEKKATEDAEGGDGPRLPQRSKFVSRIPSPETVIICLLRSFAVNILGAYGGFVVLLWRGGGEMGRVR